MSRHGLDPSTPEVDNVQDGSPTPAAAAAWTAQQHARTRAGKQRRRRDAVCMMPPHLPAHQSKGVTPAERAVGAGWS